MSNLITGRGGSSPFQSFTFDNNLGGIIQDNTNLQQIGDYLGRELKIDLINKREASLISAMDSPTAWLKTRKDEMDKIQARLAAHYKTKLDLHIGNGFPYDEAMQMATRSTNKLLEEELQELEIIHPGSATIYASGAHAVADRESKFNMAIGGAERKQAAPVFDKRSYKKHRKAKKAAKKASRIKQ